MTPELEDQLRAALRARAEQVTPETLRPGTVPAAAPRRLGRWLGPALVVAASLVVVVAGGLAAPKLLSSPAPQATQPSTGTPAPSVPSTSAPSTPAASSPSVTRTPASPGTSASGNPSSTSTARFDGVALPLPTGWRLSTVSVREGQAGCVLRPGAARPRQGRDCDLLVRTQSLDRPGATLIDPDSLGGFRDEPTTVLCPDGFQALHPGDRRDVTVGGRTGKYRTIAVDCKVSDYVIQQWVFADHPGVALVRWAGGRSTALDQTVRGIVNGASLSAGTGKPLVDFGLLMRARQTPTGVILTFDRITHGSIWAPGDVDANPRTYELRLAPGAVIRSALALCGENSLTADTTGLGRADCPLSTVLQRFSAPAGAVATHVWLRYDPSGQVSYLVEEYRP